MLQYGLKYETVQTAMPKFFIICLFTDFLSHIHFCSLFLLISSFLSWFGFFSLADLDLAADLAANLATDLAKAADLAGAIVVLHSPLFTLVLFLSHPQAACSRSRLKPPQAAETDLA